MLPAFLGQSELEFSICDPQLGDEESSMKTSKFTEAQIAFVLKQAEDGTPVAEVCRKAGISDATFYNWRKKHAGLMPSEMKRLRQLEEENAKLKRNFADLSLDKAMLQDVLAKMYGRPRRCKDQFLSDGPSLHKCIRPIASRPLLRPGHDEIRARPFSNNWLEL